MTELHLWNIPPARLRPMQVMVHGRWATPGEFPFVISGLYLENIQHGPRQDHYTQIVEFDHPACFVVYYVNDWDLLSDWQVRFHLANHPGPEEGKQFISFNLDDWQAKILAQAMMHADGVAEAAGAPINEAEALADICRGYLERAGMFSDGEVPSRRAKQ